MKNHVRVAIATAILALAVLACRAVTGVGGSENDNSQVVPPISAVTDEPAIVSTEDTFPVTGDVLLSDDFSTDNWGTGTDTDSAVEYVNEALNFNVFKQNYFVWSTPDNEIYKNVHMETTVINNGTDSTTAFGFICDKSEANDFYYLVMTPAGQYAIALAEEGEADLFLTNNDQWADSDLITAGAGSYRVGVDCGNGKLALYVDGQEIASVTDSTYTEGRVAMMVLSASEAGKINNVSFDDFVMTQLP